MCLAAGKTIMCIFTVRLQQTEGLHISNSAMDKKTYKVIHQLAVLACKPTYQHHRACGNRDEQTGCHKQQSSPDVPHSIPEVPPLVLQAVS